jgi:hypothetical protein
MTSIKTLLAAALVAGSATVAFAESERSDVNVYAKAPITAQQVQTGFGALPSNLAAMTLEVRGAAQADTGRVGSDR